MQKNYSGNLAEVEETGSPIRDILNAAWDKKSKRKKDSRTALKKNKRNVAQETNKHMITAP